MRVSDRGAFQSQRLSLMRNKRAWVDKQVQASTSRRVTKPSDDPLATTQAIRERARARRAETHQRSIDAGHMRIDAAESALSSVADVVRRVQQLTQQASNDSIGAGERNAIAAEVAELRESVLGLANTRANDSYVFAGFPDDTAPFDAAGVFVGSGDVVELDVAPGVRVPVGIAGDTTFSGAGGGVDLFTGFDDLITALQANDEVGIRASIDTFDAAHEQVVQARATLGARTNALDVADSVVTKMRDASEARQTELIGVDPLDAYSELQQAQFAFEAAVSVASQLPGPSLVGR